MPYSQGDQREAPLGAEFKAAVETLMRVESPFPCFFHGIPLCMASHTWLHPSRNISLTHL